MPSQLPAPFERFQRLADAALAEWTPGAEVRYQPLKATGRSGAAVVKIDIVPSGEATIPPGQYIIKLSDYSEWPEQEDEPVAHQRAEVRDGRFADRHIPKLRTIFSPGRDAGRGYAVLYEIAGRSLDSYVATDVRESPGFLEICGDIAWDLLEHWTDRQPTEELDPKSLLQRWLGYRLEKSKAKGLHDLAAALSARTPGALLVNGEVLPNPLTFYDFAATEGWSARPALFGIAHNDLHGGNLLVHRRNPTSKDYWIIDFALSNVLPAGFDHAYLELAHVLYCVGDSDPTLLIDVLRLIDNPREKHLVPSGTKWLIDVIQSMRRATGRWFDKSKREDDLNRQFTLAQIAAGLNWANKRDLSDGRRAMALYYAGWACKKYLSAHEPESAARFWRQLGSEPPGEPRESRENDEANELLWEQLWNFTSGFSPAAGRLILVAEAQRHVPGLSALGHLPASAVIDLDPQSHELGLFHAVEAVIESRRSVHTSSGTFGPIDFTRGTAWMMAAGWSLKSEPPTDFGAWRFKKLQHIRALARLIDEQTNPDPVIVLSIAGAGLDAEAPLARIEHTVDAIDEATQGRALVFHIGATSLNPRIRHQHLPIDVGYFLESLAHTFGRTAETTLPHIPGKDRTPRPLPIDALRAMEENFYVLHSSILDNETSRKELASDSFWRGNPPTWFDLHAGVDIRRDVTEKLVHNLRESIEEVRNRTVLLYHTPGSGGSTVALRAAWDVHREYPTAVLRRHSGALADRLQDLYNRAESPILLVADSGTLPESTREDLYQELQHRNVRVVVLYVRRVFAAPAQGFALSDPLQPEEARRFNDAYAALVEDDFRRAELRRITTEDDFKKYRIPFFYGLTAFERDFKGTRSYVSNHIGGIRGKRRDLLEYLSLVTIYTNSGLHEVFLRRMLGLADVSSVDINEALGDGPVRMMIRRNGLFRLMHQVIAEQVLDHSQGANWRVELPTLCVDFISELARNSDTHSRIVVELLRQMFVERQGTDIDDVEDKQRFAPIIEMADGVDASFGHRILTTLKDAFPSEAHFWNHLGRHQIYRMKREFDKAEGYLSEATRLSPDDHIHHHTLGLVRKHRVRQILTAKKSATASELINEIAPLFERAVQAFRKTREINEDNIYAYITHVQMILDVAASLKTAAAVRTVAQIPGDAQEWVQDQIAVASDLIDTARQLYTTLEKTDTYLTSCVTDLEKLYDNLDDVIEIWELAHERTGGNPVSRRALAYAYVNRGGERWSSLESAELRRIVELMELNLRHSGRREDDYKLWFEAYKLLPEFDVDEALSRLRIWAEQFPSWRAYFYMYSIHFHLWFSGRTQRTDEFDRALEECKARAFGRTNISHSWLGLAPSACPLVSSADLGEWDRKKNLWKSTEGLRKINGVIDLIQGPQAGRIVIDGHVRAFFVPGKEFSANKDENEPVSFFLGFSPSGIRARGVERGWIRGGARAGEAADAVPVYPPSLLAASEELKKRRAKQLRADRVLGFVRDLVRAKATLGVDIDLEQLTAAVDARFGMDGVARQLGQVNLRALIGGLDGIRLLERDGRVSVVDEHASDVSDIEAPRDETRYVGQVVRRNAGAQWALLVDNDGRVRFLRPGFVRRGQWKDVKEGTIVSFKPDSTDDGEIALDVEVLRQGDVREAVRRIGVDIIRKATADGKILTKRALVYALKALLKGDIPGLSDQPGGGLEPLLRQADGITFRGEGSQRAVLINESRAVGRLPEDRRLGVPKPEGRSPRFEKRERLAGPDASAIQAAVRGLLEAAPTRRLSLQTLGARLKEKLNVDGPLAKQLGAPSLTDYLRSLPWIELDTSKPGATLAAIVTTEKVESARTVEAAGARRDAGTGPVSLSKSQGPKPLPLDAKRNRAAQIIEDVLRNAPQQRMGISALAVRVKEHFPESKRLADALGAKSFPDYLATLDAVSVTGEPPKLTVTLKI